MEYRDALKMMRGELGVSQTELANTLHISVSTVSRWELGRTRPNRPIAALILDNARTHGVSAACLDALKQSYTTAVKEKLDVSSKNIYTVEHASLRQLIDDAAFPIYVCDMETDELLYLNQKACAMIGDGESAVGQKCYACLMQRDTPCEFCHKNELVEDQFISYDAYRPFDKTTYHNADIEALKKAMLTSKEDMKLVDSSGADGEDMFSYLSDMPYDRVQGYFFAYSATGEAKEIAVIAVKNASDTNEAEQSLKKHVEKRVASFTAYKPEQVATARDALVFTSGCYAAMIMGADGQTVKTAFDAAVGVG